MSCTAAASGPPSSPRWSRRPDPGWFLASGSSGRRGSKLLNTATVKLAVPTETRPGERRVALVPDVVKKLIASGWEVAVQSRRGPRSGLPRRAAYT